MRLSRETWLPVCAALAGCAWIVRRASSAVSTGALPDVLFVMSLATAGCGLGLWCVGKLAPLMRSSDQEWVKQQGRRWPPASAAAAVIAWVLAIDSYGAVALRSSEPSVLPVVRVACARVTAGTVKVTIVAQEVDGQWCFQPRGHASVRDFLRVDARQVRPGLKIGDAGALNQLLLPSLIFGQNAYRVLGSVN